MKNQKKKPYYYDALKILADPEYHLIGAYPSLYKVYAIAVAIPVSSCSAERSFSVLKRVKSRLRSTMLQERLSSLLLMAIDKKILASLDIQLIIDEFGKSSAELSRLLIF